jgi:hypothetical protein
MQKVLVKAGAFTLSQKYGFAGKAILVEAKWRDIWED